jgi:hypothetical protein
MRSFPQRAIGAALLNVAVYEEVEADTNATRQAMVVVVLASLATGIGANLDEGAGTLVLGSVGALIGWIVWAGLTYFIGTRLLPGPKTSSSWGELLRTTGFAAAPGILRFFTLIPVLGLIIYVAVGIWMLVAMVVAVRQALDYTSTWRAVAVCLTGWVFYVVMNNLLVPSAG